jgi:hypothetical protein
LTNRAFGRGRGMDESTNIWPSPLKPETDANEVFDRIFEMIRELPVGTVTKVADDLSDYAYYMQNPESEEPEQEEPAAEPEPPPIEIPEPPPRKVGQGSSMITCERGALNNQELIKLALLGINRALHRRSIIELAWEVDPSTYKQSLGSSISILLEKGFLIYVGEGQYGAKYAQLQLTLDLFNRG